MNESRPLRVVTNRSECFVSTDYGWPFSSRQDFAATSQVPLVNHGRYLSIESLGGQLSVVRASALLIDEELLDKTTKRSLSKKSLSSEQVLSSKYLINKWEDWSKRYILVKAFLINCDKSFRWKFYNKLLNLELGKYVREDLFLSHFYINMIIFGYRIYRVN